mmetsp:Transcript_54158/g.175012  ORF Transcript_54158/g.175012 Transcript_54158/m.175012 type:complete len:155 (-) Transcript_54158:56-520(-)
MPGNLKLHFGGAVVLEPTPSSFIAGSIEGMRMFIDGSQEAMGNACIGFLLAWLVPKARSDEEATLLFEMVEVSLTFAGKFVKTTMYSLVHVPDLVGTENVKLLAPPIRPTEVEVGKLFKDVGKAKTELKKHMAAVAVDSQQPRNKKSKADPARS